MFHAIAWLWLSGQTEHQATEARTATAGRVGGGVRGGRGVTELRFAPLNRFLIWLAWGWRLSGPAPGHHGRHSVIVWREVADG